MRTGKIVLAFCTTLAMIGGVIQYANSMPSSDSSVSEVLLTPGEMESVFAAGGGGGSGGDTGGGGGGTVDSSPQVHDEFYPVGPVGRGIPEGGSIPKAVEVARAWYNVGYVFPNGSKAGSSGCYKAMQVPAYVINVPYERWKHSVYNKTGKGVPGTDVFVSNFNTPNTVLAGEIYYTPC